MKKIIFSATVAIIAFCLQIQIVAAQTWNNTNKANRSVRRQGNVTNRKTADSTVHANQASTYKSNSATRKAAYSDSAVANGDGKALYQQSSANRKATLQTNGAVKKTAIQSNSQSRRATAQQNQANRQNP